MSRSKAIHAKCKDCIYDEHEEGTWRMQVFRCTMTDCALYPYRAMPSKACIAGMVENNIKTEVK